MSVKGDRDSLKELGTYVQFNVRGVNAAPKPESIIGAGSYFLRLLSVYCRPKTTTAKTILSLPSDRSRFRLCLLYDYHFSPRHGIISRRFELEGWNFVWCFLMTWKPRFSSRKKIGPPLPPKNRFEGLTSRVERGKMGQLGKMGHF